MTELSAYILLISIFPLILKTSSDVKHAEFITKSSELNKFLAISYSSLTLYILSIVFVLLNLPYLLSLIRIFVVAASTLALFKRKLKLYNSIEEIYEAILQIGLIFFCIYPPSSFPIFAIVLFSSISAGISKLRSPLWSLSGKGFLMFCTLPSLSRKRIRSLASNLCKQNHIFRQLMSLVSLLTPFMQISSAVVLLFCTKGSIIFLIALVLQLAFVVLLFILTDLSWIVQIYAALVIMYAYTKNIESAPLLPDNLSAIIYSIATIYSVFCAIEIFLPKLKFILIPNRFLNSWSNVLLQITPFKMFTEPHMINIITHHFPTDSKNCSRKINAFDEYGIRSSTQNFSSRHLQALMYPLGDLCIALNVDNINRSPQLQSFELNKVSRSDLHSNQLKAIFDHKLVSRVALYQHTFSIKECDFKTSHVADIRPLKLGKSYIVEIKRLSETKPFSGR